MKLKVFIVICVTLFNVFTGSKYFNSSNDSSCPPNCKCVERERKATCSITQKKLPPLRYIPRLPTYVENLLFTNNRFYNVNRHTLFNLTFIPIRKLALQSCKIYRITPDAFEELPYLNELEIDLNPRVSPEEVSRSMSSLRNITKLVLSKNAWKKLPYEMFKELVGSNISSISFEANEIENVFETTFGRLEKLQALSFRSNKVLKSITFEGFLVSLTNLDLSYNSFLDVPEFCRGNKSLLPSLQMLNLQHNYIQTLSFNSFLCLKRVTRLSMDENNLVTLKNYTFKALSSIYSLSLRQQRSSLKRIDGAAFYSMSLSKLNLAENRFHFSKSSTFKIFNFCRNLTYLNLGNNYLKLPSSLIQEMLSPLRNLRRLILQAVRLRVLPTDLFPHMPNLYLLVLTGNSITGWNDDPRVFENITSLKKLSLQDNEIKLINKTSFSPQTLSNLISLDLSNNQFSCSCELMWFRDWIRKNQTNIIRNWPRGYKCKSPPAMNRKLLETYNPTESSCKGSNPMLTVIIIISVMSSTVVIIVGIMYKSRWHIRYWIYLLRAKRHGYENLDANNEFIYDGFVIYCDEDKTWVHDTLIPKLEQESGYNLCIHVRDFDIGKLIVDNIVENMDKSRKIIVVLSNNFAISEWCQFELRVSQNRFLKEGNNVSVLIMLEEINNRHLSSSLKTLITTTTYAEWTDDYIGQTQFWDQLITSMRQ